MVWKCGTFTFEQGPVLMGILNVTPDSFSDGGQHNLFDDACAFAKELAAAGAQIIDVGGESTRPGSDEVAVEEELSRVLPVVETLAKQGFCVSIDTRHAAVAQACLKAGAHIINDVSGFRDAAMVDVAASSDCGCVVMHMQGEPKSMQQAPTYTDVVGQVGEYLVSQAKRLEEAGVAPERICLDPGPGFGKTPEQSSALIEATPHLSALGYSLMVAVSRKSYIGAYTGLSKPQMRDETSALCTAAAFHDGAFVGRVHNVEAAVDAFKNSRRAFVALGSNMQDPHQQLDDAVNAMRISIPHTWVVRVSSYVHSEPAYKEDQAVFVNAMAQVQTLLEPEELLCHLNRIEDEQGRVRHEANGPRTLDLDITDFEGVVSTDPHLTLPHPRALERDFVVTPLLEIAPGCVLADGSVVNRDMVAYGKVITN